MNTDNDGSSSFRRPPLQPKGRRGKKETPIVSLVPDTNLQSQPITVSSIPPPPPTMKKIIKRPMSPRDITPILVNGEPIQSSPVPYLSPPPSSSVEESIPAPAEKDTIFNAEIDEDDHISSSSSEEETEDEDIVPKLNSPIVELPLPKVMLRPTHLSSPKEPPKEPFFIPKEPPKEPSFIPKEPPKEPSFIPKEPPKEPEIIPPSFSIKSVPSPYTHKLKPPVSIPKTISSETGHKTCRPTDLPEFEFFTEEAALSQLNDRDYYESSSFWRAKCERLYVKTPRLKPPVISDTEPPKLAKFKYDEYYKKCSAVQSAVQIGTLIYLTIAGLEAFLIWMGIKAQGLFSLTYSNKEEYYDAMLEMGESTLGWFKGSISPWYRIAITFGISVIVLICTNYALEWFGIKETNKLVEKYKDGTIKWMQDLAGTFIGTKRIDPESDTNYGQTLFDLAAPFFGGGDVPLSQPPPDPRFSHPTKPPRPMYTE